MPVPTRSLTAASSDAASTASSSAVRDRLVPRPPPRRRRGLGALATGALVALGAVTSVAQAPTAAAHDELTGTVPADGTTVATAPAEVVLHFSEPPVSVGLAVRVTGPGGDVQQGTARIDGGDVVQPLAPGAPAGSYRVAWRVTADDGHASSGDLTFTVAAGAATATPTTAAPTTAGPTAGSATPSETATTVPAVATSSTASPATSPVAIGVVVVVLGILAAAAVVLTRRSRGGRTHP